MSYKGNEWWRWLVLILLIMLPLTLVYGAGRALRTETTGRVGAYNVSAVTTAYRTDILAGDDASATHANNLALEKIYCGGYQGVEVCGHFTVASATAVVRVVHYTSADAPKSEDTFTLTAAASGTDGRSRYMSGRVFVDTGGSGYVRVLVATPSSGGVDIWTEVN